MTASCQTSTRVMETVPQIPTSPAAGQPGTKQLPGSGPSGSEPPERRRVLSRSSDSHVDAPAPQDERSRAYEARERRFRVEAAAADRTSQWLAWSRLTLLLIGVLSGVGLLFPASQDAALFGLIAAATAFIIVAVAHDRADKRRMLADALADVNRQARGRVERRWRDLPDPPPVDVSDDHPYAIDLDLVRHASLYQLLGPPATLDGRRRLTDWLLNLHHVGAAEIRERQDSSRELAPLLDFRQQLTAYGARLSNAEMGERLPPFLAWAESRSWLLDRGWIIWVARVLAALVIGLVIAQYVKLVSGAVWALPALAGWILLASVRKHLEQTFHAASGVHIFHALEIMMRHATTVPLHATLLADVQRVLAGTGADVKPGAATGDPASHASGRASRYASGPSSDGQADAASAFGRLRQWIAIGDLRLTPIFYLPVQTLTLWDLHVWWHLERWRAREGARVRAWIDAVAQLEALAALASLAHDQPSWTFPVVQDATGAAADEVRFDARALGHPLLADAIRVTNDLIVGPTGSFLLITGSNMSGKSTLLRAIGLNAVLAHAGGPVCARTLTLPLVSLHTSMRVSDSLELGLSLFMASLVRLKQVVDAALAARAGGRPVLYLLDEVLQGTNSAERQIAVRTIVQHLLASYAIGVVTTHDLELAASPDFAAAADSRHFTEQIQVQNGELAMTFDYTLRSGPASSGNALQLLRLLGLGDAVDVTTSPRSPASP